ncbi:MAG: hypothetical protein ACJA2S_005197 [Cyclobacteriaceae bacterium]|jgi:hypothetical protein
MMHKLREAMGQRDDLYKLEGMIEFDEAYGIGFYSRRAAKGAEGVKRRGLWQLWRSLRFWKTLKQVIKKSMCPISK